MVKLSVPSYRTVDDGHGRSYTVFVIEVHHLGRFQRIEKRYRAFHTLHKQLKKEVSTPEFPPKRVRNWNSRVLEHRRIGLEHYLQAILAFKPIPKPVVIFLEIHGLLYEEDQIQSSCANNFANFTTTHQPIVTFVSDPFCSPRKLGSLSDMVVKGVLVGLYGDVHDSSRGTADASRCANMLGWSRLQLRTWKRRSRLHDHAAAHAGINALKARAMFVDFFVKDKGHTYVRPSSVIAPGNDPSLLFTNAGMNQFKSILLGGVDSWNGRILRTAANSQKCVRVGGKHNDLDDVGRDGHHHTFFEMLGNWSFGDYFKEEACRMAWELLTGPFRIPVRRLFVTYFGGDETLHLQPDIECRDVWLRIGLSPDRILPFGLRDNFWEMGNTGPCGPCTEIHYSHVEIDGDDDLITVSRLVNAGRPEVIELWNLVFVQYNRIADGSLSKLARFNVDTGMGLERLSAVLCGSKSNYDTDLFRPIFNAIHKESGCRPYEGRFGAADHDGIDTAYRVVADHARMCAVSIADGLIPDEYGAGHCLRRVIRRAVGASRMNLSAPDGIFSKLLPHVAASLGDVFPEVNSNLLRSVDVVREEEDKFLKVLGNGLRLFQRMCAEQNLRDVFPAESMWSLFFVHGLPEDFILDLCASRRLSPDLEVFRSRLAAEKAKSASAHLSYMHKNQSESEFIFGQTATELLGMMGISSTVDSFKYNSEFSNNVLKVSSLESRVLAIWDGEKYEGAIDSSKRTAGLILDRTNFYSEAGGQMSDEGVIKSQDGVFKVDKVKRLNEYVLHQGTLLEGRLFVGSQAVLTVDESRRAGCTRNHTATHLLQAALRNVLGVETSQKSTLVAPNYLRFDFSVKAPLKLDQFQRIESFVRKAIQQKFSVERIELPLNNALKLPNLVTMAGATYPDPLTVVVVNPSSDVESSLLDAVSLEPCCGTHVANAEDLMDFVILSQKSLSQVSRSIRAVTGIEAAKARSLGQRIENDVDDLEVVVSDMESGCNDNFDVYSELSAVRTMAAEEDIPLLWREPLDTRIASLKLRVTKVIRKFAKSELSKLMSENPVPKYLVHVFNVGGSHTVVFAEVAKVAPTLPSCIFVATSDRLHCQCRVPNNLSTHTFNARTWTAAIAPVLGGVERKTPTNSEHVSQIHNGDIRAAKRASEAALDFIKNSH